jgi:hypothetical protein
MSRPVKPSKLYVGKIFSLRKHNKIRTSGGAKGNMTSDELGPNVLVLDEKTKDVEVMSADGVPVWISRYYLGSEIRETIDGSIPGELGKIITEMLSLKGMLGGDNYACRRIEKLIRRLRVVQENVENES